MDSVTKRLEFHEILVKILGSRNVYYQPPSDLQMVYPCFRYKRDKIESDHANDKKYKNSTRYQVTLIDKNPDSSFVDKLLELPESSHQRSYPADGLNHDVFEIYY